MFMLVHARFVLFFVLTLFQILVWKTMRMLTEIIYTKKFKYYCPAGSCLHKVYHYFSSLSKSVCFQHYKQIQYPEESYGKKYRNSREVGDKRIYVANNFLFLCEVQRGWWRAFHSRILRVFKEMKFKNKKMRSSDCLTSTKRLRYFSFYYKNKTKKLKFK